MIAAAIVFAGMWVGYSISDGLSDIAQAIRTISVSIDKARK